MLCHKVGGRNGGPRYWLHSVPLCRSCKLMIRPPGVLRSGYATLLSALRVASHHESLRVTCAYYLPSAIDCFTKPLSLCLPRSKCWLRPSGLDELAYMVFRRLRAHSTFQLAPSESHDGTRRVTSTAVMTFLHRESTRCMSNSSPKMDRQGFEPECLATEVDSSGHDASSSGRMTGGVPILVSSASQERKQL